MCIYTNVRLKIRLCVYMKPRVCCVILFTEGWYYTENPKQMPQWGRPMLLMNTKVATQAHRYTCSQALADAHTHTYIYRYIRRYKRVIHLEIRPTYHVFSLPRQSILLSICIFIYLSACLSTCLSVRLSVYIYPYRHQSIYLSLSLYPIYPSSPLYSSIEG